MKNRLRQRVPRAPTGAGPRRARSVRAPRLRSLLLGRSNRPSKGRQAEVEHELVRSLFVQATPMLILGWIGVLAVVGIFWASVPHALLFGWAGIMAATLVGRTFLVLRYLQRRPGPQVRRRWGGAFAAAACVTGLCWGIGAALFLQPGSIPNIIVLMMLVIGLSTAAIAGFSAHSPTFYLFLVPTIAPFAARIGIEMPGFAPFMAALTLFWLSLVAWMQRSSHRHLYDRLALQIENAHLVAELSAARDDAEAASRAKTRFLANISHELRTPLNAIIGFSDVMKNRVFGPLGDPKYERYADYIHESGAHLMDLMSDILDVAKVEAGQADLRDGVINVRDACMKTLDVIGERARIKGVDIRLLMPRDLPPLRVDPVKFRQIVLNLLTNAIKFTDKGGRVEIDAELAADGGCLLQVADNGCGMDPAEIPQALTPFVQLSNGQQIGQGGTGLGLPLVKSLVELHGGMIRVKSARGRGTVVTLKFPANRVGQARETDDRLAGAA